MRVLDVGSSIDDRLPQRYSRWERVRLDIDPLCKPDIVMDARQLPLEGQVFDAVYCSHVLEHFHRHDALKVLLGFTKSLVPEGYAHIRVPDVGLVMHKFVEDQLDMESVLYRSLGGPVTVHDVIYGHGQVIMESGSDYYAHKTGFTWPFLKGMLTKAGFRSVEVLEHDFEIEVFAYMKE